MKIKVDINRLALQNAIEEAINKKITSGNGDGTNMHLTKDQDFLICQIYKMYLQSVKLGNSKVDSKRFSSDFYLNSDKLMKWNRQDLMMTLNELGVKNLVHIYIGGSFYITDEGIYYMENRFKNGLDEVTDFIAKFIP